MSTPNTHLLTSELSEDGKHIRVSFNYNLEVVNAVKEIPGFRFIGEEKGGPYWQSVFDLEVVRQLDRKFGEKMRTGPLLKAKAMSLLRKEKTVAKLARADHAELLILPEVLPDLYEALYLGPKYKNEPPEVRAQAMLDLPNGSYQTADVAFLSNADNPLNGLHPGLGKTLETIGSIFECGMDTGAHLVICPKSSIETVWQAELELWQPHPVLAIPEDSGKAYRMEYLEAAKILYDEGQPFWLLVNPAMVRYQGVYEYDEDGGKELIERIPQYPVFFEIEWTNVILDEIHKAGFRNLGSLSARAMLDLKSDQRIALSGTPIGGKPINLWRILHWLHPDKFASKTRWEAAWLQVEDVRHDRAGGTHREVGDIKPGLEDEFYDAHAQYFLRRTKEEVLPWLPPKQFIHHWAEMSGPQEKQYKEFALEAEIAIGDHELSATSILAEYTRLKQFATALCDVETVGNTDKLRVFQTQNSCKLLVLEEILEELGVFEASGEQVVVFSQFTGVVDMVCEYLTKKKVVWNRITGETTGRADIQRDFQGAGGATVLVMNVHTGGVSITLDMANTVVFMDETWVPDDQEQAEDRCHRASRIHQVTCHYIRTKDTIEEYIHRVTNGKMNVNNVILDLRRKGLRATR